MPTDGWSILRLFSEQINFQEAQQSLAQALE
jgi:hypothetical protein